MTGCECAHTVEHNHLPRSKNTHLVAALAPRLLANFHPAQLDVLTCSDHKIASEPKKGNKIATTTQDLNFGPVQI